jgi:hypothetical protein
MWDLLTADPNRVRICVFYILPIVLAVVASVGIKAWRKNEAHKRDNELKLEMLARGMSAEDIARVLTATINGAPPDTGRLAETLPYVKK